MNTDPNKTKWQLFRHDKLGRTECPYVSRWIWDLGPLGSVRLHHWMHDDKAYYVWPGGVSTEYAHHDHPWGFLTIMLWGHYEDIYTPRMGDILFHSIRRVDHLKAGSIRWRPANWTHSVETNGAWTLLWTQPKSRRFGYWRKTLAGMKWVRANKFLASNPDYAAPCQ